MPQGAEAPVWAAGWSAKAEALGYLEAEATTQATTETTTQANAEVTT